MRPAPRRCLSGLTASKLTVNVDLLAARITVVGELDRYTIRHLVDAVRALAISGASRWIMDVEAMTMCDASGLRALSACYRSALRRGADMTVVGASPWLRAALSRMRLDQHLVRQARERAGDPPLDRLYPLVKMPPADLTVTVTDGQVVC